MPDSITQPAIARIEHLAQLGLFDAADAACRELLASAPGEHKGWAWLGMLAIARGQAANGEPARRQAIALWPNDPRYWNTLALSLRMQGKAGEGEAAAKNVLALADSSEYWGELGNCLFDQQRWQDASHAYQQALARSPSEAQLWTNFAAAEHSLGDSTRRKTPSSKAYALPLAIQTRRFAMPSCWFSEGISSVASNWSAASWLTRRRWRRPGCCWATPSGCAIDCTEAQAAYRQARRECLTIGMAALTWRWCSCSSLRLMRRKPGFARSSRKIRMTPTALTVLGGALHAQARIDEAISAMGRSVELAANPTMHSKLLVALHYSEKITPEQLLTAHCAWDAAHARPLFPTCATRDWPIVADDRLRIGLVAVDFSSGPTGFLALPGIECRDRSQCSIICYSDRGSEDDYTRRFCAAADGWRQTMGLTDEELAEQVRRDEIDVFVDLGGMWGAAYWRLPAAPPHCKLPGLAT